MHLSIDLPFCIGLFPNAHFFTTLHPMTSCFCFFDQNFLAKSSAFEKTCKSQQEFEKKKVAQILCSFTPNDSLFQICHPVTPIFARKLSLIPLWFDALVGTPHHCCMWVPPCPIDFEKASLYCIFFCTKTFCRGNHQVYDPMWTQTQTDLLSIVMPSKDLDWALILELQAKLCLYMKLPPELR